MGVVNTTPDSFSDGGHYHRHEDAVRHALKLIEEGADILDIGGESTRPGADSVSIDEEMERVIPVIESLVAAAEVPISVDTSKVEVMRAAMQSGAAMINDVNGLRAPGAVAAAAEHNAVVCIMHMLGEPKTMQAQPQYEDVIADVSHFLTQQIDACLEAGIPQRDIIGDPGIGFGKTLEHNLALLNSIAKIRSSTGCEMLIGVSRKSMIDAILNRPVDERLAGSLGLAVQAVMNGAKLVRVHDVRASHDAIRCAEAVMSASNY